MNLKNEKGVTILDYVVGLMVFVIGSVSVLSLYVQIYKMTSRVKVDETILGYVTEICEEIDMENYEDITIENVNKIINSAKIPQNYKVECKQIEKYFDNYMITNKKEIDDVVERIYLNISYNFNNLNRNFEITKIKVKE